MKQLYEITPPPELVGQWCAWCNEIETAEQFGRRIATQAAQWGADQELEACLKWMGSFCATWTCGRRPEDVLRAARRPKPPSLKERALQAWAAVEAGTDDQVAMAVIRRALEQLDD